MSCRFYLSLTALALALGCNSPEKKDAPAVSTSSQPSAAADGAAATPPKVWADKMQGLAATLSELLPLVASRAKFNEQDNFAQIESRTRDLRSLSHDLKSTHAPNVDPMTSIMTRMMSDEIDRALDSLRSGNRDYARQVLKDTTSYCFQCHTQTEQTAPRLGNQLQLKLNVNTSSLSSLDQAEYFAATQQFDRALEAYRAALSDGKLVEKDSFAWEQAARSALAIIVRVKNDPKQAALLVTKLEKQPGVPEPVRHSIASWKKSIHDWPKTRSKTGDELQLAGQLVEQALRQQEFPLDHSQDIVFFRASRLVHDFLQRQKQHEAAGAKALYIAGEVAESTRDMNFWTLHETYYEQCIRWLPHSKQAEACFDRLKDSVTLGYSGSSGVNVPIEVAKRLESFRVLADADSANPTGERAH